MIGWILCGLFAAFAGILVVRAFGFRPRKTQAITVEEAPENPDKITDHLARMIRCKTVSSLDPSLRDEAEFEKFRQLLMELYPTVYRICPPEPIGQTGLLYTIKGKSDAAPIVFMAHYDVVPAVENAWAKPPFGGLLEDGVLWGRGTLDMKTMLCGILESAETLLAQGFVPQNDVYIALSGDEEIAGPTAPDMVAELEKRGIRPAMVLDEGGAVVQGVFPGVDRPCALIGIGEKGMLDLELTVESKGGHASTPPPHTPVGVLAQAVTRIENRPFKSRLTAPVAGMFDTLGRHSSFAYRLLFANLWCFLPLLDFMCRKRGGILNALMRTTCAFTMMEGSNASNVIPPVAKMRANLRLIGGDTPESAIDYLQSVANNSDIQFRGLYGMNPSIHSKTDGPHWELLQNAIAQTWPEALVSPYLMFACSDSRHYCRISDGVYRFSAVTLSQEERETVHGHNERVPVESAVKAAQFYLRVMRGC